MDNYRQYISKIVASSTESSRPLFELKKEDTENLKSLAHVALVVIAILGVATVMVVAPNVLQLAKPLLKRKNKKLSFKEKQDKIAETFYYLKNSGFIKIKSESNKIRLILTKLGKEKVERLKITACKIPKAKKWDAKWWLVAADIPTKDYKNAADSFRDKVKELGFYPLQRTLWLYPYNPTTQIEFIANYYNIGRFVTVMEVSRLDEQDKQNLKRFFRI